MLRVRELVLDAETETYVASWVRDLPPAVAADDVELHLRVELGPPVDAAVTDLPDGRRLRVGWSYRLPAALAAQHGVAAGELVVTPLVLVDGVWTPLFEHLDGQRRLFPDGPARTPVTAARTAPATAGAEPPPARHAAGQRGDPTRTGGMLEELAEAAGWPQPATTPDERALQAIDAAGAAIERQHPEEALAAVDPLLADERATVDGELVAELLVHRGNACSDLGRYDEALAALGEAAMLHDRAGRLLDHARVEMELGITLARLGRTAEARARYESALLVYEQGAPPDQLATLWGNLANVVGDLGDHGRALDLLGRAEAVHAQLGDRLRVLDCRFNAALVRWTIGELGAARAAMVELAPAYAELGLPLKATDARDVEAALAHEQGEFDHAMSGHRRAAEAYRVLGRPLQQASALASRAHVHAHRGELASALGTLADARALYEQHDATAGLSRCAYLEAWVEIQCGDPELALALVDEARRLDQLLGDAASEPWLRLTTGAALRGAGRLREAVPVLESALPGLRALGVRLGVAECHRELGLALAALGEDDGRRHLDAAREHLAAMGLDGRAAELEG